MTVDESAMKVALSGVLQTWVSDKKAAEKQTTYVVGFRYLNGRLHVSEFKETSDQDPFGASKRCTNGKPLLLALFSLAPAWRRSRVKPWKAARMTG
jgi:hypothetical protein